MKFCLFKKYLTKTESKQRIVCFLKFIFSKQALRVLSMLGGAATLYLVYLTIGQLSELKKYNRLSTSPNVAIQIDQGAYGDSLLKINNYGGGYATLYGVHVKDKTTGDFLHTWKDVALKITGNTESFSSCGDTIVGYPFGSEGERSLLVLRPGYGMISKKMNVDVSICYCSMYEECWESEFLKPRVSVQSCDGFEAQSEPVICNAN